MKNYDFKDAFMILKAIEKTCKNIYDSKSEIIVKQLENTDDEKYRCKYGLFSLKNNAEKIVKEYTAEEKAQFDEIQMQIDRLKIKQAKLGTIRIEKEAYNSLVYHKDNNGNAQNEANDLLADLIATIGNATMIKASKKLDKRI